MADHEKSLLSQLTSPDKMSQAWNLGLRAEVFEDPTNQDVYAFIADYWQSNSRTLVPTEAVLETEFPAYTPAPGTESLTWLVGELKKRYTRNQVQDLLVDAAELVDDDPSEAISLLQRRAHATLDVTSTRLNRVNMSDPEAIKARRTAYADLIDSGKLNQGAPMGLTEVDEHTGGLQPGELGIVVAYTKVGKSFTLCNAAVQAMRLRQEGYSPLVISLEQSVDEFQGRIDCFSSGVGYGKYTRGELTLAEIQQLHAAQEEQASYGNLYVETMERGDRTVKNIVNRAREVNADYLIIDQLSHMDVTDKRWKQDATEKNTELIFDLKDEIARESAGKVPCLMAVQFNRQAAAATKVGDKPSLEQIANSADIERTVDIAYSLYGTKEMRHNKTMVLEIMAARRSDQAAWLLNWHLNNKTEIGVISPYVAPAPPKQQGS